MLAAMSGKSRNLGLAEIGWMAKTMVATLDRAVEALGDAKRRAEYDVSIGLTERRTLRVTLGASVRRGSCALDVDTVEQLSLDDLRENVLRYEIEEAKEQAAEIRRELLRAGAVKFNEVPLTLSRDELAQMQLNAIPTEMLAGGEELLRLEVNVPESDDGGGGVRLLLHVMPHDAEGAYNILFTRLNGDTLQFHELYRALRDRVADLGGTPLRA